MLLAILFSLCLGYVFAEVNVNVSGVNEAKLTYRSTQDSLKNYFSDKFSFQLDLNSFTFGMKFISKLPEYSRYQNIDELTPKDIDYKWDERYVSYSDENYTVLAGTFEETFGLGILLRAYNNTDLDRDTRLDGLQTRYTNGRLQLKGVYGSVKSPVADIQVSEKDIISGADAEYSVFDWLKMGSSIVQYQQRRSIDNYNSYTHKQMIGGRATMNLSMLDFNTEYVGLQNMHNESITADKNGYAFYSNVNYYPGKFTFTSGYSRYLRYDFNISDLPTLNHYDELISSSADIEREEGLMGQVTYVPEMGNEMTVHYSEYWNESYTVRSSNLYTEYKKEFSSFNLKAEFEHYEKLEKTTFDSWEKEETPTLCLDFIAGDHPVAIKTEFQYKEKKHANVSEYHYEPLLQVDLGFKNWSFSVLSEYAFKNSDDFGKNSAWVGGELKTNISKSTEMKLFGGREKGGKVCRNGVCRYQSPFDGVRLELTTRF